MNEISTITVVSMCHQDVNLRYNHDLQKTVVTKKRDKLKWQYSFRHASQVQLLQ
jgi:hypothetical protein